MFFYRMSTKKFNACLCSVFLTRNRFSPNRKTTNSTNNIRNGEPNIPKAISNKGYGLFRSPKSVRSHCLSATNSSNFIHYGKPNRDKIGCCGII